MSNSQTASVVDGPKLPDGFVPQVASAPGTEPGKCRPLDRLVTLIGSRRDCDLSIEHTEISKVHCALIHTGRGLAVADLCSRSGTFLNGERVTAAAIKPGDALQLGPIEVQIEWGTDEAEGAGLEIDPPLYIEFGEEQIELSEVPAMIGRRSTSQITVDTPDVSLAHAIIFAYNGRPAIFDVGSRSGTILNESRVELSWLRDNDVLTIGGETLDISWAGTIDEDAFEEDADPNADTVLNGLAPAVVGGKTADPSDLGGLLQLITSNIEVLQKSVELRAGDLVAREQELDAEHKEMTQHAERLQSDGEELKRRTSELDERMAEVIVREKDVNKLEKTIEKRTKSLDRTRDKLRAATAKLRQERKQIEGEQVSVDKASAQLRERESEVERQERQLREEQAACEAKRQRLEALEQELTDRQSSVEQKEGETKALEDRMEAFQKALAEASEVFGGQLPGGEGAAVEPPAASAPEPKPKPKPKKDNEQDAAPAAPARARNKRKPLPGPVVDQPLFGAEQGEQEEVEAAPKRKRRWWS